MLAPKASAIPASSVMRPWSRHNDDNTGCRRRGLNESGEEGGDEDSQERTLHSYHHVQERFSRSVEAS